VYISTSDDTMAPDCLEKLVAALEMHPDCDLENCSLVIIDKAGSVVTEPSFKRPDCTLFARGFPGIERTPHLRRAPYDGLLHLIGLTDDVGIGDQGSGIRKSFERIARFGSPIPDPDSIYLRPRRRANIFSYLLRITSHR
jgi:hypothetical protein